MLVVQNSGEKHFAAIMSSHQKKTTVIKINYRNETSNIKLLFFYAYLM